MPVLDRKKIIAFGILFVVALGGVSVFLVQQKETQIADDGSKSARVLRVDHYFENGVHTYMGTITAPTPCHDIVSKVTVMESYPEQVTIDLKLEGASNFCAQVITQAPFEASFKASKDARISATLDGNPVILKVTEKTGTPKKTPAKAATVATTTVNEVPNDSFLYEGSAVE